MTTTPLLILGLETPRTKEMRAITRGIRFFYGYLYKNAPLDEGLQPQLFWEG
eukprot:CAMPEP_0198274718 /NCGR_PEP_ID=MMETSP1447-20131203/61535_1 /TAXON_ID=420782 /ORGANISM="Chaetoceros dichaeta, Strain CCMP1751" /LENGTH=51 /DNA_ID=CAMNT_0043969071 /DNA_START=225 /DNA_END=380 /DNA_ORIENTATION=-